MKEQPEVIDFLSRDMEVFSNPEWGAKNFNPVKEQFQEIRTMLKEIIEISSVRTEAPAGILRQASGFVTQWIAHHNRVKTYNFDGDAKSEFKQRQHIIEQIEKWYESCFSGYDPTNQKPNNFLSVYNTIKSYNLRDVELERNELTKLLDDIKTKKLSVDTITDELRKRSAQQTVSDYSLIFQQESERHSSFSVKEGVRVGAAEKWLSFGICFVGLFVWALSTRQFDNLLVVGPNSQFDGAMLINLLTRLIIMSIWLYVISFCFKQFSVNKHLATLNRHRSNTLDSFKLFIESIDPSDSVTKNALMLEVAKSIYEHGNTGHLSSRPSDSSPSIIELTRFVNQGSSKQ